MRALLLVLLVACAKGGEPGAADAPPGGGDSGDDGSGGGLTRCPVGELVTNVTGTNTVTCAPAVAPARAAVDAGCNIYWGWRDDCDGCTTGPAKWGRVGTENCVNGTGVNNTCTMQSLGGQTVRLFGLDPDGDVDGNDKLYGSLHCSAGTPTAATTPCPAGSFVDGKYATNFTCGTIANAVVDFVQTNCRVYFGWQDGCDGCQALPAKWGQASGTACMNGVGADNTCHADVALSGQMVDLFGLNPDGDVDGNDKLHVGLRCTMPMAATTTSSVGCPAGQFVFSVDANGSFQCQSIGPLAVQAFAERCTVYFGWRDDCDGCTSPPVKWGTAKVGACANGAGADNTCTSFNLGGQAVSMFGLNTDGDVDGNDSLYIGLTCR